MFFFFFSPLLNFLPPPPRQGKSEFINDVASLRDLQTEQEIQRFKNESLGMAVLHLSHIAIKKGISLEEVARKYR